jgi:hypothetical protein
MTTTTMTTTTMMVFLKIQNKFHERGLICFSVFGNVTFCLIFISLIEGVAFENFFPNRGRLNFGREPHIQTPTTPCHFTKLPGIY